jgi:toxin ParE1/3/4
MSSPRREIHFAPIALEDFAGILRYTGERWGQEQLHRYAARLDEAIRLLADYPDLGHLSRALPDTHRLYVVGSHVIVYRAEDTSLAIVRILHQRMNLPRHVD